MALMSFRQYAKHRGVSTEAVSKAVKTGRLTNLSVFSQRHSKRKLIDASRADVEWAQNTMRRSEEVVLPAAKRMREASPTPPEPIQEKKSAPGAVADPPRLSPVPAPEPNTYVKARGVRETFLAQTEALKYEAMAGKLTKVADVRVTAFRVGRVVREAMMVIPDRISAQLAEEKDAHQIHLILSREIRKALEELSDWKPPIEEKADAVG